MEPVKPQTRPRSEWTVEVHRIRDQAPAHMSGSAAARVRALLELSLTAWKLSGKPVPDYERGDAPVRIVDSRGNAVA